MTRSRPFGLVFRLRAFLTVGAALLFPAGIAAQAVCRAPASASASLTSRSTDASGPLARTVSLEAGDVTLRAALDLVASAGKVRLSYSGELLPLERHVCASWQSTTVGAALAELLSDVPVQAVAAGADHVVLAPARASAVEHKEASVPAEPVYHLDGILVEGAIGSAARGETVAKSVVSGRDLENRSVGTLGGALNALPGVWTWGGGPESTTRFGSVRGASSFGVSAPKVYIDGIEAANPLLVSRLMPETVDRIEVIRGPQGAGIYGADAIGGVVNVVTRREAAGYSVPRARFESSVGSSSSLFSSGIAMSQDHALSLRAGTKQRNAGLDLAFGSAGDYLPGASSSHLSAVGSGRLVQGRGLLDATLRYSAEGSRTPPSPLLAGLGVAAGPGTDDQSLHQYTLGLTGSLADGRWTHSATVGVDGYELRGVFGIGGALASAADSALSAASGSALRSTFRLSTVGRYDLGASSLASLTMTAERSALVQHTTAETAPRPSHEGVPSSAPTFDRLSTSRTNYGLSTRADASWNDRLFLSGGLRLERTDAVVGFGSVASLPMLGAAAVQDVGPLSVKLRGAYGRGIRWPQLAPLPGVPAKVMSDAVVVGLAPEMQSGFEGGVDLSLFQDFSLHATRFDQTARGLVQRVESSGSPATRPWHDRPSLGYRIENVGEIANRGWELEASLTHGPLSLDGGLSLTDSRVLRLAQGYAGDLRPGDRTLEVPARTLGLTATWNQRGWLGSLTAYRASDWINYDRLAMASDLAAGGGTQLTGEQLRSYWRPYSGVTHLGATLSRQLFQRFTLTLAGDNLLGYQLGEPDNLTVLPGRTLHVGVRASLW